MRNLMNLPMFIIEELESSEMILVTGGKVPPVSTNNGGNRCSGNNNQGNQCSGTNNEGNSCSGTNNGGSSCGV